MDKINKRYGRLVVIKKTDSIFVGGQWRKAYICKCDCGKILTRLNQNISNKNVNSCGCYTIEQIKKVGHIKGADRYWNYKHGMFGTRFYQTYFNLNERCHNKKHISYRFYGKLGIKNEFKDFQSFYDLMYESYVKHTIKHGIKQTTIDRINSLGNYSPSNCKWSTYKEQANNRKDNLILTYHNKQKTLSQWCEHFNMSAYLTLKKIRSMV